MRYFVQRLLVAIILPLFAVSAYATGSASGVPASGTPASGVPAAASTIVPINLSNNCQGGGTRVSTGTYDSSSGALSITTTLTNCVDTTKTTHNGTVVTSGSISSATGGAYSINLTYQFNTHYVNSTQDVQRICTWAKVGEVTAKKFTGTITKTNCTLNLADTEAAGNIVEHIQKISHQTE